MIQEVYKDNHEELSEFLEYNEIDCPDTEAELRQHKRIWKDDHNNTRSDVPERD